MPKMSRYDIDEEVQEDQDILEVVDAMEDVEAWDKEEDFMYIKYSLLQGTLPSDVTIEHEWLEDEEEDM